MPVGQTFRHRKILETLNNDGLVEVEGLASLFDVTPMTIRRDLSTLESGGYLVRTHGGAVKSHAVDAIFSFERRLHRNRAKKERICRVAAEYIKPGNVVFIDCGTTLFRLGKFLHGIENLRVITNSLPLVSELSSARGVSLTMTGGDLVLERRALYGRIAEETIRSVHADIAFIGADGVSDADGLSSFDEKEGSISLSMARSADRVVLLCDSSKIGHTSYYRFGGMDLVDVLVTDSGNPARIRESDGFEIRLA